MAKICIYGAGSIGCHIGGRLLAAGSEVRFVGRAGMGTVLRQHGLELTTYRNERWSVLPQRVDFHEHADAVATADLVLVTVKSAATPIAAAEMAQALKPGAIVISFQNGMGNADALRTALPQHVVLAGMVPFNVVMRGPGAFHQGSAGQLEVQAAAELQPFLADFGNAGLPLIQHADMLPVQWAKLLFNLNNAINALSNMPLKEQLSQRAYRRCLALAQAEALALLRESDVHPAKLTPLPAVWIPRLLRVPDFLFERLGKRMLAIDPLARSSMSDDLAAGRATEVDWINGEVLRLADRLGRHAPVNARLCALVHAAEQSVERPSWPADALLKEIESVQRRSQ
ncbi:2-dehydropantoate 2-reductase [Rhodanobacter sp. C01]|uniref:2-dehydropantoate 2-reductase n=1 Tax=Rhodanobacter sp. C01 TaxID=1945856 RepID=UPI000986E17F|nr:2-dehydropantoate 2-reductase [Rhodanobacter sp. C01]OOG46066.1 2-dehydropantoate 2-reductase [Rhodanobacter sp. C01]